MIEYLIVEAKKWISSAKWFFRDEPILNERPPGQVQLLRVRDRATNEVIETYAFRYLRNRPDFATEYFKVDDVEWLPNLLRSKGYLIPQIPWVELADDKFDSQYQFDISMSS